MRDDETVTDWIAALKTGDPEAARLLWERYFQQLVQLARQKLSSLPRRVADEEDVALSVFRRLCEGAERGRFEKLTDRDDLWQLLATITARKVIDVHRRQQSQKRGGGRVRGDSVFGQPNQEDPPPGFDQLMARDPTPEFLSQLADEHQRLLELLGDDVLRRVALWKLEGLNNEEVAAELGQTSRSVRRKLERIRDIWREEIDG